MWQDRNNSFYLFSFTFIYLLYNKKVLYNLIFKSIFNFFNLTQPYLFAFFSDFKEWFLIYVDVFGQLVKSTA